MEFSDWIALSALVVSALAVIASISAGRQSRRDSISANETALKAQADANRVAELAAGLQALDWSTQYFSDVRNWADLATSEISRLIHLNSIEDDSTRQQTWVNARSNLSALIRGRWFFPNEFEEQYGHEKPPAYRGYRQRILDHLVDAYNVYSDPPCFGKQHRDGTPSVIDRLVRDQRWFVSDVQKFLNPRDREKSVTEIMERFAGSNKMWDDDDFKKREGVG